MPSRSNRADVLTATALLVVAAAVVLLVVFHNPYRSARGVREVREFVGQPPSFAERKLGRPARDFTFRLADAIGPMPRGNLPRQRLDLPRQTSVRELTWDEGHTFLTVWYQTADGGAVGIYALQWDKGIPTWAADMASPPAVAPQLAP